MTGTLSARRKSFTLVLYYFAGIQCCWSVASAVLLPDDLQITTGAEAHALGDLNGDRLPDVITSRTLSSGNVSVEAFYRTESDATYNVVELFQLPSSISLRNAGVNKKHSSVINSIVAGDYDLDGKVDLLIDFSISWQTKNKTKASTRYHEIVYSVSLDSKSEQVFSPLPTSGEFLITINANNDLLSDFLVFNPPRLFINHGNRNFSLSKWAPFAIKGKVLGTTVSTADVNGDCLPDLVFLSKFGSSSVRLVLYINNMNLANGEDFQYSLNQELPLPSGISSFLLSDIDDDGLPELMFPICLPVESCEKVSQVLVLRRRVSNRNSKSGSDLCAHQASLDDIIFAALPTAITETKDGATVIRKKYADPSFFQGFSLVDLRERYDSLLVPTKSAWDELLAFVPIRSMPRSDESRFQAAALVRSRSPKSSSSSSPSIAVLTFEKAATPVSTCKGKECGTISISVEFQVVPVAGSQIDYFTVADLSGDGRSQALLQWKSRSGNPQDSRITIHCLPLFSSETYFLKIISAGLDRLSTRPLSPLTVSVPGSCASFSVAELSETTVIRKRCYMDTHMPRDLSDTSLHFGLGSQSAIVPDLVLSLPVVLDEALEAVAANHSLVSSAEYSNVIPNSKLILVARVGESPSQWRLSMFMSASARIGSVVSVLVATVAVLGTISLLLTCREAKRDRAEALDMAHAFSFNTA